MGHERRPRSGPNSHAADGPAGPRAAPGRTLTRVGEAGRVSLAVLGTTEIRVDREVVVLPRREREVVARLAIAGAAPVPADRIADAVWDGTPPATGLKSVQVYVNRIRRRLGADLITTDPRGYSLADAAVRSIDAMRFERLLHDARREGCTWSERSDLLEEALSLWRGPAFADVADREWARAEAARLDELRSVAIEARAEARLASGDGRLLIPELEALVADMPLRERLWELLMVALYREGRQADALAAYQRARRRLREEAGLEPGPSLRATEATVLAQDEVLGADHLASVDVAPGNLPSETSTFVGREDDQERIVALLDEARLVTLVGPAGAGKTRLALRVAAAERGRFADGVWFVDLALDDDLVTISRAVRRSFGAAPGNESDPVAAVTDVLRGRRALLVLDNCEHVLDAAARLAAAIQDACPAVRMLATSRVRLGLTSETLWSVAPLPVPAPDAPAADVVESESVRLFIDRARSALPTFDLDDIAAHHVGTICRRLDGIPLAIELAAAWTNVLGVAQIEERVADRFTLLAARNAATVERHRTLRAAIDWSFELLDDDARSLLSALSVFRGSFTMDAARSVAGADVLLPLAQLVDASLVAVDAGHVHRYRLLESIRAYAAEKLATDPGRARAVAERHCGHYVDLADQAWRSFTERSQIDWIDRVEADVDNLRTAISWAANADPASAQRIVADAGDALVLRGHAAEVIAMAEAALGAGVVDPEAHAGALAALAEAQRSSGSASWVATARAALDEAQHAGAPRAFVRAAESLAGEMLQAPGVSTDPDALEAAEIAGGRRHSSARLMADYRRAIAAPDDATGRRLEIAARESSLRGDAISEARAHAGMAFVAAADGRVDDAATHLRRVIAIARDVRHLPMLAGAVGHLVELLSRAGDPGDTARALDEVKALGEDLSLTNIVAAAHGQLGLAARRAGDLDRALLAFEDAFRLHAAAGDRFHALAILGFCGRCHLMRGDVDAARDHIERARHGFAAEFGPEFAAPWDAAAAEVALHDGDVAAARALAASGLAAARALPGRVGDVLAESLLSAARVACAADEPAEALERVVDLLDEVERGMHWLLPAAILELGRLAVRCGRPDVAAELVVLWDAALGGRLPAPPECALAADLERAARDAGIASTVHPVPDVLGRAYDVAGELTHALRAS